jgi:hypothetical protein
MHAYELNGTRILEFSVNDAEVSAASDSSTMFSLAIEHQAALVILPASEVDGALQRDGPHPEIGLTSSTV